jgi:hypothetical protein
MNRYNPVHEDAMVADENGTHVRYEDHAAALRAERAKLEKFAAFAGPDGEPRKVLPPTRGPHWFKTTDGALVPNTTAIVYAFEMNPVLHFTGRIITMNFQTWFDKRWDDCLPARWNDKAPDGCWGCYSTEAAAKQAAEAAAGGKK